MERPPGGSAGLSTVDCERAGSAAQRPRAAQTPARAASAGTPLCHPHGTWERGWVNDTDSPRLTPPAAPRVVVSPWSLTRDTRAPASTWDSSRRPRARGSPLRRRGLQVGRRHRAEGVGLRAEVRPCARALSSGARVGGGSVRAHLSLEGAGDQSTWNSLDSQAPGPWAEPAPRGPLGLDTGCRDSGPWCCWVLGGLGVQQRVGCSRCLCWAAPSTPAVQT